VRLLEVSYVATPRFNGGVPKAVRQDSVNTITEGVTECEQNRTPAFVFCRTSPGGFP
jgi:hypothetical protein